MMIEIPLKKRHTEVQDYWATIALVHKGKGVTSEQSSEMQLIAIGKMLATIADRLTDISDALKEQKNGK